MSNCIVNQNLEKLSPDLCDWSLSKGFYTFGPCIVVNNRFVVGRIQEAISVDSGEMLRTTFMRTKRNEIFAKNLEQNIHLEDLREDSSTRRLVVPDRLRWGELQEWCDSYTQRYNITVSPVATAPGEKIIEYLLVHLHLINS